VFGARLRRRGLLALVAALVATPFAQVASPAFADVSLVAPASPAGDQSLFVPGADARGHGTFRARLLAEYAHAPLVVLAPDLSELAVVERQLFFGVNVSLALYQRLLLDVELPFVALQRGEASELAAPNSSALADVRASARARVLGAADSESKLSFGLALFAPTGTSPYTSSGGFGAEPFVSASHERERLGVSSALGFRYRESASIPSLLPLRTASAVTFGVAASAVLDRSASVRLGPELSCDLPVAAGTRLFDPRSTVARLLLALSYRPRELPVSFALAFGPGLGDGPGAADYHAALRIAFSPEQPPPPPDGDSDTVPDLDDACPSIAGVPSGDPLMHGCPELATDTDGDAIPDIFDACPQRAGLPNSVRKQHGCPPIMDRDRDRVPDENDACPDVAGEPSADTAQHGCPPPPPEARLEAEQIVISEQVLFETGTATIKPASDSILSEVLQVLRDHPELLLVEVQGHTDSTGSAETNRKLSHDRAHSVVDWLVARGVPRERLRAEGHGAERPIADNETETGRERNRRVEFRVIEREAKP
jgi:outer membrane protein OmpA-like peptidoglycan-associated protein